MKEKEIKLPKLPREKDNSPTYKAIVVLNYLSSLYEYLKGDWGFIWDIPRKYNNIKDIEISALTACFIYDGTKYSISAAKEVDSWFKGEPYRYIISKEYYKIIMVDNQNVSVYDNIKLKDIYLFFKKINELYSEYDGIIGKCRVLGLSDQYECVRKALDVFRGFNGASVVAQARVNLFMFMTTHCTEIYPFDQSKLLAPLFPRQFAVCKVLRLTRNKRLTTRTCYGVTKNLQWFSKKYPMTFWVGVVAYSDIYTNRDSKMFKILSTMENKRRVFIKK